MKVACGENHKLVNGDLHVNLHAQCLTWIGMLMMPSLILTSW